MLGIAGKGATVRGYGIAYDQLSFTTRLIHDSIAIVTDRVIIAHPTDIGTSMNLTAQHNLIALCIKGFCNQVSFPLVGNGHLVSFQFNLLLMPSTKLCGNRPLVSSSTVSCPELSTVCLLFLTTHL